MYFQQGLLFGLRPEVAVDYYPAISTMIGHEKKNYMKAVECGAPTNRPSRETRRSLGLMVQQFPYLSKAIPDVNEDFFYFLKMKYPMQQR